MMRRLVLLVLAILLATGAGVAAASVLVSPAPDRVSSEDAAANSDGDQRTAARAADPKGGPPWAVRSYTGDTGLSCLVTARVEGRAFGPLVDGQVRDLPVDGSGSCTDVERDGLQLQVGRYAATAETPARTVLYGRVSSATRAIAYIDGRTDRDLPIAEDGCFIAVFEGLRNPSEVRVRITDDAGLSEERGL